MKDKLRAYYRALRKRYGPRHWWPAETPFEVMVGAILTQNTSWKNVEKAISTLKAHDLLDPRRLLELDPGTLELAIRPAGFFRLKARRLREYLRWYVERHDADDDRIRALGLDRAREELLAIRGIGPETADSILLYGFGLPTFVVDRYTWRVLTRHGIVPEEATYADMKELFERHLKPDAAMYNEYHALLVSVGKDFCRATARCDGCPLKRYLPK
jgi:endonuclease-3 related protein